MVRNSQNQNIKKVYSIWLCVDPAPEKRYTITKYEITEKNIIGNVHERKAVYDLLTVVIIRLGKPEDIKQKNILRLLNILFAQEYSANEKKQRLQEDFEIPMAETIEGRIDEMCNLGQGLADRAEKRGELRGELRGEKRTQEIAINAIMQKFQISRKDACDIFGFPYEPQCRELRNAQNED